MIQFNFLLYLIIYIKGKWTPSTWNAYPKVELQMLRNIKEPSE